jgi:hypothetical protein
MGKLAHLSPLIGTWATTITMQYPAKQRGRKFYAEDAYRWLPGNNVIVHDVAGEMDGQPVHSVEIYWQEEDGQVLVRSFDSGGEVSDFEARMEDSIWHISGETQRFVSSPISDAVIEGVWQLKVGAVWVDWMTVLLSRRR